MTEINDRKKTERFVAAMAARMLLADLHKDLAGKTQYTDAELRGSGIELNLTPGTKKVLRETAFSLGESMVVFCKQAMVERVQKVLAERIAAAEADDAEREAA